MGEPRHASAEGSTATALLRRSIASQPDTWITLEAVLGPLRERAFGVLLVLLAIPNFVPLAVGIGGVAGVGVIAIGAQLAVGATHPWLPRWIGRRKLDRARLIDLLDRIAPMTGRIERACRPRLPRVVRPPSSLVSGVMLMLLGALLALPLPFTNYLFASLLLVFAFALVERDGALLLAAWALILTSAGVLVGLGEMLWVLLRDGAG